MISLEEQLYDKKMATEIVCQVLTKGDLGSSYYHHEEDHIANRVVSLLVSSEMVFINKIPLEDIEPFGFTHRITPTLKSKWCKWVCGKDLVKRRNMIHDIICHI